MKAKNLERIREFASIVFDQAYRLLNEIEWAAKKMGVPNDVEAIDNAIMSLYRELEAAREEVDPAEWENKKVDGSRTGQDILENLDEILTLLHPKE